MLASPFPPIPLVADQIGEEAGSEESSVQSQYLRRRVLSHGERDAGDGDVGR